MESPRLSQSKFFLKIIGILYLIENTHSLLIADMVEKIIKDNYIFNNIVLVLRPRVIKVLPKFDVAIVWINIWDTQSSAKAKGFINRYFNVGSFIATI